MPLDRRFSVAAALVAAAAAFSVAGSAQAQDASKVKQLYDEGMGALEKGDFDAALEKFKALFAEDPNQAQMLDLIRATESNNFLKMLSKGGEHEKAARHLLSMGRTAAIARSREEERIRPLVETAVKSQDLEARRTASRKIMAEHGPFAIPFLVPSLGSNDTDERVRAIFVIEDIGVESVHPLCEVALGSPDAQVRQSSIIALRKLMDPRARPVLDHIARTKENPESVRRAAEAALKAYSESMGKGAASAEEGFLRLADQYYNRAPEVLRESGSTHSLWSWQDGKLVSADCPAFLHHLRLAERACGMAIHAAPQSRDARAMLGLVYAAQQVALETAPAAFRDGEAGKAEATRLAMTESAVRASGPSVVLGALALAIKYDDAPVAVQLMKALPSYGSVHLGDGSPVAAALKAPDPRIQWHAALACIRLQPKQAFPGSETVVPLAANAVALSSVRQALVISDETKSALQMQNELNASGLHAVVARTGAEGLLRSKGAPFDVILVAGGLKDLLSEEVVNEVRRDYRTKEIPILFVVPEAQAQAAKDRLGASVSGVLTTPLSANVYVPLVKDAASKSPLDDRARALALSEDACAALAEAGSSTVFDFSKAQDALAGTLSTDKPESLKLKALAALRKWGGDAALSGLVGAVGNSANPESVRAESARVTGIILSGKAPTQKGYETLLAGLTDASPTVRSACAGALGSARLNDAQRNQVAEKTRP